MEPCSCQLCLVACTRDNGHKLDHKTFPLVVKKHFVVRVTEHWHRLPRQAHPVEIFKTHPDMVLGNLL